MTTIAPTSISLRHVSGDLPVEEFRPLVFALPTSDPLSTGWPRSASHPFSTKCSAAGPSMVVGRRRQRGGIQQERTGLRPAESAVRAHLVLEGRHLIAIGVVQAVHHHVGRIRVAGRLGHHDDRLRSERAQRVVTLDLAGVEVSATGCSEHQ